MRVAAVDDRAELVTMRIPGTTASGPPPSRGRGRLTAPLAAGLVLCLTAACGGSSAGPTSGKGHPVAAPAPPAKTIVSLTFDDATTSQYSALSMLMDRGMRGTVYVNSGLVGSSDYYLNWWDLQDLHYAGQEIGGHTVSHANLEKLGVAKATAEVCKDRQTLLRRDVGPVTSFAYPYAGVKPADEAVVRSCGYTSARDVGRLRNSACPKCAFAETMPPKDPYRVRTAPDAAGWTLEHLQKTVTKAEEHGGGWVTLVFHGICHSCTGKESLSPTTFRSFLDWLEQRRSRGTVVRPVGEVMRSGTVSTGAGR